MMIGIDEGIVIALITLSGGIILFALERRAERRRTERTEKLKYYTEFLFAAFECSLAIIEGHIDPKAARADLTRAHVMLSLFSSRRTYQLANELFRLLINRIDGRDLKPLEEWKSQVRELRRQVRRAIRDEIGFEPLVEHNSK